MSKKIKDVQINKDEVPSRVSEGKQDIKQSNASSELETKAPSKNIFLRIGDGAVGGIYKGAKFVGSAVTHSTGVFAGKVSEFLGVSKKTVGLGTALLIGIGAISGGIVYSNHLYEMQSLVDETVEENPCKIEVEEKESLLGEMQGDENENAMKIWSLCMALGYSPEQAAGVLGNFSTESGIDPTSVEGIYDEKYNPTGPQKLEAYKDWCSYTIRHLATHRPGGNVATDGNGHTGSSSGNTAFYAGNNSSGQHQLIDGHPLCFRVGVGLGQFTGPNWYKLMKFVSAISGEALDDQYSCANSWYKIDYQLAFICCDVNNGGWQGASGGNFFTEWSKDKGSISSPEDAADIFLKKFEGGDERDSNYQKRLTAARDWFNKLQNFEGDASYAQSILSLAQTTVAEGAGNAAQKAKDECEEEEEELPFDIARAAVAYAYEHYDDSYGNDGTQLYQNVHRAVYPGDPWFQSCDRGAACAIKWAGADDNYPPGDTSKQDAYLQQHPEKWEYIGRFDDLCNDVNVDGGRLQPGDVIIRPNGNRTGRSGHTFLYVSYDIVAEKYPNAPYNAAFVSASYKERSAAIELWTGQHTGGNGDYDVYRCKQYEENSPYVNMFDAMKTKHSSTGRKVGNNAGNNSNYSGGVSFVGKNGARVYRGDGTLAGDMRAYARTINADMLAYNNNPSTPFAKKWHYAAGPWSQTYEEAARKSVHVADCSMGAGWLLQKFGAKDRHTHVAMVENGPTATGSKSGWKSLEKRGNKVVMVNKKKTVSQLLKSGALQAPCVIGISNHVFMYLGDGYWFDTGSGSSGGIPGKTAHTPFGTSKKNGWIIHTDESKGKAPSGGAGVIMYCNVKFVD